MTTMQGVGWISQVQFADGEWVSWTQWKEAKVAENHVARLLKDNPAHVAGRVVRVDWTVVAEVPAA